MKCIAYISRTPTSDRSVRMPTGLSDIISVSRKHNPQSQITGIISYREGQYLQIIEGPYAEVDKLMAKIATDPRHEDLWVFLDGPVEKRSFDSWAVNVFDFVDQNALLNTFVENHMSVLTGFDDYQKSRIQPFIDIKQSDAVLEKHYEDKDLRLLAWPDLNTVSQPQLVMNLCIKLTKKPYPFNSLVNSGEFGAPHEVTQMIRAFDQSGLLSITESEPVKEQIVVEKKPNKFYGAIKKFLGMR